MNFPNEPTSRKRVRGNRKNVALTKKSELYYSLVKPIVKSIPVAKVSLLISTIPPCPRAMSIESIVIRRVAEILPVETAQQIIEIDLAGSDLVN